MYFFFCLQHCLYQDAKYEESCYPLCPASSHDCGCKSMSSVSVCRVVEVTCSCPSCQLSASAQLLLPPSAGPLLARPGPAQPSLSSGLSPAAGAVVTLGCTVDLITPAHEHHCDKSPHHRQPPDHTGHSEHGSDLGPASPAMTRSCAGSSS